MNLRIRLIPAALFATIACASAFAAPPATTTASTAKPQTAQQQRMGQCAALNKGKKGAEYKAAQSACLKADSPAAKTKTPQQERMAKCSAQNKGKKGNDYKAAQSACLKGA